MEKVMIQSISHPELFVTEDGEVYKDGTRLYVIREHGLSIRGPIVVHYSNGRIKQLSVARLVFEAFIKKAKLLNNDYIDFIDNDENNVMAKNLVAGTRYGKKNLIKKETYSTGDSFDCWMNGNDEIYI